MRLRRRDAERRGRGGALANRTIRSAVEREFTIIGEAVNTMSRQAPELAERISNARKIVGFRNQLVHDYMAIKDEVVWAIAQHDAPVLREECLALIDELERADQRAVRADSLRSRLNFWTF